MHEGNLKSYLPHWKIILKVPLHHIHEYLEKVVVLQPNLVSAHSLMENQIPTEPPEIATVLNEFTHGKQQKVSKTENKEAVSDILLGMAAGLKRDPIVILRIDGEDLDKFINGPIFEPEMVATYSEIKSADGSGTLRDYIAKALEKLTVISNILEPALESCTGHDLDEPVSQGNFIGEFKKVAESLAQRLKEQPVNVVHSETDFDGSGIKRLLSNKFELDKLLNVAIENVPKDHSGKLSKEYLRVALDVVAPTAGLPSLGVVEQMDKVVQDAFC
ncbi:hypothetical protein CerSpe_290500 [Prunus speciosa]